MATVAQVVAPTASTSNAATYATGSFTPVAGTLLVVWVHAAGTVTAAPTMTASANGITFTRVLRQLGTAGVNQVCCFIANQMVPASPVAMTVTFDCTGDNATGAIVSVAAITGMTKVGSAAVKQSIGADNNVAASGTPTVTFGAAPLTTNCIMGAVGNNSSPAGLTPPTSYTELGDVGFSTPTTGLEVASRDSGQTTTAVTWGNTSATAGVAVAIEFDTVNSQTVTPTAIASAEAIGTVTVMPTQFLSPTGIASGENVPGGGGSVPSIDGSTTVHGTVLGTVTGTLPSGSGTILVAFLSLDNANTVTPPAGWTSRDMREAGGASIDAHAEVFTALATVSDFVWNWSDTTRHGTITILRISGAHSTNYFHAATGTGSLSQSGATTYTLPIVTTTVDNCLILGHAFEDLSATSGGGGNWTWPGGWTEYLDLEHSVEFFNQGVAHHSVATAGASTNGTLTAAVSDLAAINVIAIAPGGGGGPVISQSATVTPTAIASAEVIGTPVITLAGATTLSPTGIASGEAFPGGGGAFGASASITGIEPESHSYAVPVMDTNGNLYRVTESFLTTPSTDQYNQPKMMKSSDGGHTWAEIDAANRPGAALNEIGDLESGWTTYETGGFVTFTWQRSYPAYSRFRASDHPTNPDTWLTTAREQAGSGTGTPQYMSHTSPTDQSYQWLFFCNGAALDYRNRNTGTGAYNTQAVFDAAGASPAAILDVDNTSHVLYKKSSQLHYKTLTSAGTLQGTSTRVDTNGVHTEPIPHAAPQVYKVSADKYVGALFTNAAAELKFVLITNGTPGTEETITTSAVTHNPDSDTGVNTSNQAAVISLALDGTTFYAIWADNTTGDVMYSSRPHGGAWSTPTLLVDLTVATRALWTYAKVLTYPATSRKVLAFTYDHATHGDNDSNIKYNELLLSTGGGVTVTQSANLVPTGIASAETIGTLAITSSVSVSPTGITSAETIGSPTAIASITTAPVGIPSTEALGTPVLDTITAILAGSIPSAEAFGAPSVASVITATPTGIPSLEAFGTLVATSSINLIPDSILTAEQFGTLAATSFISLSPASISTAEQFGTAIVQSGMILNPGSISTAEQFGTLVATSFISLSPGSISTAEQFGTAVIQAGMSVVPSSILTDEQFGTLIATPGVVVLTPTGIVTAEGFGSPAVSGTVTVSPSGIVTEELVGTAVILAAQTVSPASILTGEVVPVVVLSGNGITQTYFIGWGIPI